MTSSGENPNHEAPAYVAASGLVDRLLPGVSPATKALREQILDFCFDPTARTAFLSGDIGVGKSTVARVIGFGKRVAFAKQTDAELLIRDLRFTVSGLIDEKFMPWYVELPLTGVAESLAEAQVFGVAKRFASFVDERPGVFESASQGRKVAPDHTAVKVTGGIVFLDEIAEIPQELQAKLLPVLSGGVFHRVGGENVNLTYEGITVAASWKGLGKLRPDLVSRITDRVIHVPNLSDRRDDLPALIDRVQEATITDFRRRMNELSREPSVDRFWMRRAERIDKLDSKTVTILANLDWSHLGNLRGLSVVIRQLLFTGKDVRSVLKTASTVEQERCSADHSLTSELLKRTADGSGLANHVRQIEIRRRTELREALLNDDGVIARLSEQLRISTEKLRVQAKQLNRSRRIPGRRLGAIR